MVCKLGKSRLYLYNEPRSLTSSEQQRSLMSDSLTSTRNPHSKKTKVGTRVTWEFQATEHLLKHGWVMLPKNTPSYAPPIFEGFERLIVAPLQVQTRFRITDPNEYYAGTPDLGLLVTRKGELKQHPRSDEIAEGRTRYDRSKFLFHFNDRVLPKLIAQGAAIEPYRQMILSGWNVDIAATILAYTVTTYMDQIAPGYRFSERMALDTRNNKTRAIIYPYDQDGRYQPATLHRDQSMLTIHHWSNFPGLVLFDSAGNLVPINETKTNEVLVFLSTKMFAITRGRYEGTLHGVYERRHRSIPMKKGSVDLRKNQQHRHTLVSFIHGFLSEEEKTWMDTHASDLHIDQAKYRKIVYVT